MIICKGCFRQIDHCQCTLLSRQPIARNTDEDTSHLAAEAITRSGKRAQQHNAILNLVIDNPGKTSAELGQLLFDRYVCARRLPELQPKYVRKGHKRRCHVTGRFAVTWWPIHETTGGLSCNKL